MLRRPVEHRVDSPEEGAPGLVVEDDYHRGGRQGGGGDLVVSWVKLKWSFGIVNLFIS